MSRDMLKKLGSVLVAATLLLPGCFTAAGALVGAGVAHTNNTDVAQRRGRGEQVPEDEEWSGGKDALIGGALGLVVDVALVSIAISGAAQALSAEEGRDY
jgi:hypothetical protein